MLVRNHFGSRHFVPWHVLDLDTSVVRTTRRCSLLSLDMPGLRDLQPVTSELGWASEESPILTETDFFKQFGALASDKRTGLVVSNKEGKTTARAIGLLSRVPDLALRSRLATLVHNGGQESCQLSGERVVLIKSPCFTDDFGCFVTNSGVFEGFRAVAVAVDHEVGNSRQERMPTAHVRSGEAIMMTTDGPWETHGPATQARPSLASLRCLIAFLVICLLTTRAP